MRIQATTQATLPRQEAAAGVYKIKQIGSTMQQGNRDSGRSRQQQQQPKPALGAHRAHLVGGAILAIAILLIIIGVATAQAHEYTNKGVTVSHPWARATPGGINVGGAYLEITAAPGAGDKLIGGKSPVAGSVEVHSHTIEGGVAKMRRIDGLPVKGGSSVVLKPGGYHIMLLDLKEPLKEGDLLKLTLTFEKAGDIEVDATVEPVGAKGPHGFDSQPTSDTGHGAHKH